jgi:hypothetical protein
MYLWGAWVFGFLGGEWMGNGMSACMPLWHAWMRVRLLPFIHAGMHVGCI